MNEHHTAPQTKHKAGHDLSYQRHVPKFLQKFTHLLGKGAKVCGFESSKGDLHILSAVRDLCIYFYVDVHLLGKGAEQGTGKGAKVCDFESSKGDLHILSAVRDLCISNK